MKPIEEKVVLMGDSTVGKSALLIRYIEDQFNDQYNQTLGVKIYSKTLDLNKLDFKHFGLKNYLKDYGLRLNYRDLGGQNIYSNDYEFYFELNFVKAVGVMIVYDISNRESYDNLEYWINELVGFSNRIPFIIVGNKLDRSNDRQIEFQTALETARYLGVPYVETSAKTNKNVANAFESLTIQILRKLSGGYRHRYFSLPTGWRKETTYKKCETCRRPVIHPYPEIDGELFKFCPRCFSELQDMIQYSKKIKDIENLFDGSFSL